MSFVEDEHAIHRLRNEWDEKYASGLIDNYHKASRVPYGTTDCENDPESKTHRSLS